MLCEKPIWYRVNCDTEQRGNSAKYLLTINTNYVAGQMTYNLSTTILHLSETFMRLVLCSVAGFETGINLLAINHNIYNTRNN